jgi:hypothetical protein
MPLEKISWWMSTGDDYFPRIVRRLPEKHPEFRFVLSNKISFDLPKSLNHFIKGRRWGAAKKEFEYTGCSDLPA